MSDEIQEPKKRGRKPRVSVTQRTDAVSIEDIAADINRRRLSGERISAKEIPMREPGRWALREANSQVNDGRHYEMVHKKGWVPCTADDLDPGITPQSIGYRLGEDGQTLVRGQHGDARLYKKDKQVHDAIKRKEAEDNTKSMRSERAAKEDVANAAAAALGPEAADYLHRNSSVKITDQRGPLTA